ncbi:hypothetical protein F5141DRAFT_1219510 [Pisolithus sp. B1]|nr:hypothetical protein F5141DRAFT_1219510 [Pisolithus sp. B1]
MKLVSRLEEYDDDDPIMVFDTPITDAALLSGPGGSTLRVYDTSTGHLLLECWLHNPTHPRRHELQHVGITAGRFSVQESTPLFALTNGDTVSRMNNQSGDVVWTRSSLDQGSLVVYFHLRTMPDAVYIIGLAKSKTTYTLRVTTLSIANGST